MAQDLTTKEAPKQESYLEKTQQEIITGALNRIQGVMQSGKFPLKGLYALREVFQNMVDVTNKTIAKAEENERDKG